MQPESNDKSTLFSSSGSGGSRGGRGGCGGRGGRVGSKDQHVCHHCGIPGLLMSNCYKLHGYPSSNRVANALIPTSSNIQESSPVSGRRMIEMTDEEFA